MTRGVSTALVIILTGAVSTASATEGYYLYKPEKAQSQKIPAPGEGVLTKTITIQKGDTLSRLSRRYSGRSSFFPQILLFNRIKNPDLIIAGAELQVPLTSREAPAPPKGEKAGAEKHKKHVAGKSAHRHEKRAAAASAVSGSAGARLFKRGVSAYAAKQYRRAIEIFDEYLESYPNSPNAANAALYRAECYENLAGE